MSGRRRRYNEIYKVDGKGNVLEMCCLECEEWKDIKEYGKDKSKKEGYRYYCNECYNDRMRDWDKDYKKENGEWYSQKYYKKRK